MRETWPQWALGALVVAAVIAALTITGGPETARQEERDAQRRSELFSLARQVRCLADAQGDTLPVALTATEACPDPLGPKALLTAEGYRYEPIAGEGDKSFRLCASFERPERLRFWTDLDPTTGCLIQRLRD